MKTTQQWLQDTKPPASVVEATRGFFCRPVMEFNDGTTLSVQASKTHYCSPQDARADQYFSVEVWQWPTAKDGEFLKGEPLDPDFDDVAGWVPVERIDEYAAKHGGIKQ